jgi:hypothetical protein
MTLLVERSTARNPLEGYTQLVPPLFDNIKQQLKGNTNSAGMRNVQCSTFDSLVFAPFEGASGYHLLRKWSFIYNHQKRGEKR